MRYWQARLTGSRYDWKDKTYVKGSNPSAEVCECLVPLKLDLKIMKNKEASINIIYGMSFT